MRSQVLRANQRGRLLSTVQLSDPAGLPLPERPARCQLPERANQIETEQRELATTQLRNRESDADIEYEG